MKLKEIAARIGCPYEGDGDFVVQTVKSAENADSDSLTFVLSAKYKNFLESSAAGVFIIPERLPAKDCNVIRSPNPYLSFAQVLRIFYKQPIPAGPFIHPSAVVADDVTMGDNCYVGANVVIEAGCSLGNNVVILANTTIYPGVTIGNDVLIHSNCIVREYCQLGNGVILQNGAVIGADGFGFAKTSDGEYFKIPQSGRVILADQVEIQSHACIDRGTLDDTFIGKGTKIDNLVQIAHGCEIGENTVIASQVGLAGSTTVGNNVMLGGQVGVAGHCIIGDNVIATAQSGIPSSVEKDKVVSGYPAVDNRIWLRASVAMYKLPELLNRVRDLEKEIAKLKELHE